MMFVWAESFCLNEAQDKVHPDGAHEHMSRTEFFWIEHTQSHFASLCCQESGGWVLAESQMFTHSISAK